MASVAMRDYVSPSSGSERGTGGGTWEKNWLKSHTMNSWEGEVLKQPFRSWQRQTMKSVVPLIKSTAYGLSKRGGFKGGLPANLGKDLAQAVLQELLSGNADSIAGAFWNIYNRNFGEDPEWVAYRPGFSFVTSYPPQMTGCGGFFNKWSTFINSTTTPPSGSGCFAATGMADTFEGVSALAGPGNYVVSTYSQNPLFETGEAHEVWQRYAAGTGALTAVPLAWRQPWSVFWPDEVTEPRTRPWPVTTDIDGRPWREPWKVPATEFEFSWGGGGGKPPVETYHERKPGKRERKRNDVPFGFFAALKLFHTATEVCDFFGAVADGLQGVRVRRSGLGKGTASTSTGCAGDILYVIDNYEKLLSDDGTVLANVLWNIAENDLMDRALGRLLGAHVPTGVRGWESSYQFGVSVDTAAEALMEAF